MNERKWYEIRAQAGAAEVYIYEQIGEDLFGEGVSAKNFCAELAALDVASIALHVNSPGGSVFDGQAIYNAVRRHPAQVTSFVDGVAASIASVVALAGDHVVMARNALFMIHDPFAPLIGTAADHRKMAEVLDQVTGTILGAYREKTGRPDEEIARAMADETWYSAQEALEFGFIDEVAEPLRVAASFDLSGFGYRRPPVQLIDALPPAEIDDAGRVLSAANERDLRDAAGLITGVLDQVTKDACTAEPAAEAGAAATAAEARPGRRLVLAGDRFVRFSEGRKR